MAKLEEIWQNLEKKRNTDYDFPPPLYQNAQDNFPDPCAETKSMQTF